MSTPTRDEQLVRDFLRPLSTVEPARRTAPMHHSPQRDPSNARRYAGYAAIGLAAVLLVAAIALISQHGKSQKPAHRPPTTATFAQTHGWITLSGNPVLAVNPADPAQTGVLPRSIRVPVAWSPDGSRLLAVDERGLVVVHSNGRRTHLASTRSSGSSFTPDGARVIFAQNGKFWTIPAQGGQKQRVPAGTRPAGTGYVVLPDYFGNQLSPDGGTLVYSIFRLHQPGPVWLVDSDGSDPRQLVSYQQVVTKMGYPDWQHSGIDQMFAVSWLGDGSGLVITARNSSGSRCAMFAVNADGSDLRRWGPGGLCPTGAALSPDRTHLAFAAGLDHIVITDNSGRVAQMIPVPQGKTRLFVAWQP